MSYNVLAETTFAQSGVTWTIQILENGYGGSVLPLQVIGANIRIGRQAYSVTDLFEPVAGGVFRMQFIDASGTISARLNTATQTQFKVRVLNGISLFWIGYVVPDVIEVGTYYNNQEVSISAVDGIGLLKGTPYNLTGYYTLNELFRRIFDEIGHSLNVRVWLDWDEDEASGSILTNIHRVTAEQFLREGQVSYFDVLTEILTAFNLIAGQFGGRWNVIQRSMQSGTKTYFDTPTASGAATSGSANFDVTLLASHVLQDETRGLIRNANPILVTHDFLFAEGGFQNANFSTPITANPADAGWYLETGTLDYPGGTAEQIDMTVAGAAVVRQRALAYVGSASQRIDIDFDLRFGIIVGAGTVNVEIAEISGYDTNGDKVYLVGDVTQSSITPATWQSTPGAAFVTTTYSPAKNGTTEAINVRFFINSNIFQGLEIALRFVPDVVEDLEGTFHSVSVTDTTDRGSVNDKATLTGFQNNQVQTPVPFSSITFSPFPIEFYDGTDWVAARDWNGGYTFGRRLARLQAFQAKVNLRFFQQTSRYEHGLRWGLNAVYGGVNYPVQYWEFNFATGFTRQQICELRNDTTDWTFTEFYS